jgi:hypothetical protein
MVQNGTKKNLFLNFAFSDILGPTQVRRERIARELLETEENYVKNMLMLNVVCTNSFFREFFFVNVMFIGILVDGGTCQKVT